MTEPTDAPTEKQIAFLRRMAERCYTSDQAPLVDAFISSLKTRAEASKAIQTMIDAGYGDERPERRAQPAAKASHRQVDYAERLVDAVWHDSGIGQGARRPTRGDLERMSARDISSLIRDLKADSGL